MAKLQRNFVRGRMNKDLDERLVPNGEYRDAQNIQISTSTGSDVGAVESILGNAKKNLKTLPNTTWEEGFGLNNLVCIGSARDTQNDKIYWFITSDSADAILEYDKNTNLVAPILVDTQGVLNFNADYLITGINVLDGLLYWTDDLNEPKVINIATFKAGSDQGANTDLSVHTQVYGRDFIEKDTTVITEVPLTTLFATPHASLVGGPGTGVTPIITNNSPGLAFQFAEVGDIRQISWSNSGSSITWPINSKAIFTAEIEQPDGVIDKYQITGEFTDAAGTPIALSSATTAYVSVSSATANIPSVPIAWKMLLIEDDPIFKNDFPRFSYRYKFTDGRYSTYAPFSLAAFVAGEFKYLSRDGNNAGMESNIRKIRISSFPTLPDNVEEFELLYKSATSNNIYVIETFEAASVPTTFDIESSLLGPVIESNQILRLYDNVPRKAKSQEIISNRVVYGNYVQNYNMGDVIFSIQADAIQLNHTNAGYGLPSIKSDREYQIGVSFLDNFGRESPIFTSKGGGVTIDGANAEYLNKLQITLPTAAIPGWASYYKFYIKDSAPEYYNIALDRYYNSEDGGVWLSFPSAERNKLQEGKYIVLKKQHDSSTPVKVNNKYKILNISNQVPENISSIKTAKAKADGFTHPGTAAAGNLGFELGDNIVVFLAPLKDKNENFFESFTSDSYVSFQNQGGGGSGYQYKVTEGGPTGEEYIDTSVTPNATYAYFEIKLAEGLKAEDEWITNLDPFQSIKIVSYKKETKIRAEFQGRFFAKVDANAALLDNIQAAFSSNAPTLTEDRILEVEPNDSLRAPSQFHAYYDYFGNPGGATIPVAGSDTFILGSADHSSGWSYSSDRMFRTWAKIVVPGTKFKFRYIDGSVSQNFYTVLNVNTTSQLVGGFTIERTDTITMDRDFDDTQYSGAPSVNQFDNIVIYREQELFEQELLSSSNPAIFETEPDEQADLDIYWEVSDLIDVSSRPPSPYYLNWYNCYSFGNGVESDRIRDDFNTPTIGKGVRVNAELKEPYKEERRKAGLIYSGIYNNIAGINETNQFIAGLKITKDLDPVYGGIQKLFARDTNLLAFAEDKVYAVLADKDALFNADGNANLLSTNRVLGNASTFAGEYGISKNPESFATHGFRTYFTDKARGAVLRLSIDGLTVVSDKGMSNYIQDGLKATTGNIIGFYDEDNGSYNVTINNETLSFKEDVDGWPTKLSYNPESALSLNNELYSFRGGEIWEHSNLNRANFYNTQYDSYITTIFNESPSAIKNFKTLSYQGDSSWSAEITTDQESGVANLSNFVKREGLYESYIQGIDDDGWNYVTQTSNIDFASLSILGIGEHSGPPVQLAPGSKQFSFNVDIDPSVSVGDRLYFVDSAQGNLIYDLGNITGINRNSSPATINTDYNITPVPPVFIVVQAGEFIFAAKDKRVNTSGIIGYYANVTMTNTNSDKNELFAVGSEAFISSE